MAPNFKAIRSLPNLKSKTLIFSELKEEIDYVKRFDNSPVQALALTDDHHPKCRAVVCTTSGTPALFAAEKFDPVWIGSLVGFSSLVRHLNRLAPKRITLIPAALPGSQHHEDEIVATAFRNGSIR